MADHADDEGDYNDVFVYRGGNQRVPFHVTHVRIHKSVKIIRSRAFEECHRLVSVEMHDGVEIIERGAFSFCYRLRGIKLPGVRVIEEAVFHYCRQLADVKFGDKLDTIGENAFYSCTSLRNIKVPNVRVIGEGAFAACTQLKETELPKDLERIEGAAFGSCPRLRRIVFPLKRNLFDARGFLDARGVAAAFYGCNELSQVDLVGGRIHKTISSLLLDSWRHEMNNEMERINRDLPNTPTEDIISYKTLTIHQWIEKVFERMEHYKSEHYTLLKEDMTLLELALWDANIENVDGGSRQHARVTCGANIIIPHVLSFLNDSGEFPLRGYDQANYETEV